MTCIVGIAEDGKVWMGADSATTWEDDTARLTVASNPKAFRVGPVVIGCCGSGRALRLLQYSLSIPARKNLPADRWVSTVLVDSVRKCLSDGGALEKKDGVEQNPSSGFLIGYRGRLWRVDNDFNVDESRHSYDAVGAGSSIALGALHATQKEQPRHRIMSALRAAQEFNWSVRAPFVVLEPRA